MIRQIPVLENITDTDTDTESCFPSNKRRKTEIESSSRFSFESVSDCETVEGKLQEKESRFKIDHFKKFQCCCNLVNLIENPDRKEFNEGFGSGWIILESNPMDSIKSKLEKNMYFETDEFAADIRHMFSDAILNYPPKHKMHRTAKQLRELFERNWKSLEEESEAEKREEEEEEEDDSRLQIMKKQLEPSRKLRQSSAEEQSCGESEEVCDNFSISCWLHNQSGIAMEEGKRRSQMKIV